MRSHERLRWSCWIGRVKTVALDEKQQSGHVGVPFRGMTRKEAQKERDRLSQEHPEATWLVREEEGDGGWSVVKVGLPQTDKTLVEEQEARSRPPHPDDPLGSTRRNFRTFGAN